MAEKTIPGVVIAAMSSGTGKTTIVTGILACLKRMGRSAQSYKVGPDYIDPGYHQLASGRPGHNLDTWLVPEEKLRELFCRGAQGADVAIVEGVMGLYDGGRRGVSSTAQIAKLLGLPVVLVINAQSMGESAAAVALGFKAYDLKVNLAGVILNRVGSDTHERMLREAMAAIGMPVFGCIRRDAAMQLPERHLGLTPVTENDAADALAAIERSVRAQVDVEGILALAKSSPARWQPPEETKPSAPVARIAVARDEAFTFYYPESLRVLEQCGAEIVPFSPLADAALLEADGLLIGGGFPEMFAQRLAENASMRASVRAAAQSGMPVLAECGGLMYLTERLVDFKGAAHEMAGVIPAVCRMHDRLQTVGYVEATALADTALCPAGAKLRGHEFHFSTMEPLPEAAADFPWAFEFEKVRTGARYPAGFARGDIVASYLHLHFAGDEAAAARFVGRCAAYAAGKKAAR